MPTLTKPSIYYPEYIVTNNDILNFIKKYHSNTSHMNQLEEMIYNTTIEKRHLFFPFDLVMNLGLFEERQALYEEVARKYSLLVAQKALDNSGLTKKDITMIITTSCTGFMMPSLTAHLINGLDLPENTIQLPIAQMGCVGGAYAINRAFEHCQLSPTNNVLIVALETSSLCFHREAGKLQDFISDSIFGDGAAGVVMRGDDVGEGLSVVKSKSIFLKNTESFIQYNITNNGFLFSLDKQVMYSVEMIRNQVNEFIQSELKHTDNIDFCISHTGGRRILDEVQRCLNLKPHILEKSRESLKIVGNTSSVSVIDVLSRHFGNVNHKD